MTEKQIVAAVHRTLMKNANQSPKRPKCRKDRENTLKAIYRREAEETILMQSRQLAEARAIIRRLTIL